MTRKLTLNEARVVYVYFDERGEVMYIGEGSYWRPYNNHHKDQRDQRVNSFMNVRFAQDNDLRNWIKYVATYLEKTHAVQLESALIKEFNPRLNTKKPNPGKYDREIFEKACRKIRWRMLQMELSFQYRRARSYLSLSKWKNLFR